MWSSMTIKPYICTYESNMKWGKKYIYYDILCGKRVYGLKCMYLFCGGKFGIKRVKNKKKEAYLL